MLEVKSTLFMSGFDINNNNHHNHHKTSSIKITVNYYFCYYCCCCCCCGWWWWWWGWWWWRYLLLGLLVLSSDHPFQVYYKVRQNTVARRVGTSVRQPNRSLDFEASNLETLHLKKISKKISGLLTDDRNLKEVREKLFYLDNALKDL